MSKVRDVFSIENEAAVLGAALTDPDALLDIQALGLRPEHFFSERHALVWAAMGRQFEQSGSADVITVADALSREGHLEDCGGLSYLGDLCRGCAGSSNATAYAFGVLNRYRERECLVAAQKMRDVILAADGAPHEQRMQAVQAIFTTLSSEQPSKTECSLDDAVRRFVAIMQDHHENPGIHGVLTGLKHVDHRAQGLQPGELAVIAGRPGTGKSALAMQIAHHVASVQHKRVLVFSLEMPAHQLAMRMIASCGPIKMGLLKSAKVLDYEDQAQRLTNAMAALSPLPLTIDDQGGLTVSDIATRARRAHRRAPLGLVVIDYLQLIATPFARGTRNDAVSDISRALKALAKELDCPMIVLSQLSRKCEERGNKRPIPSDLRDSGAVEQDADVILFVYRDRMHNEQSAVGDQAEIITAKSRNGETGTDYVIWDGAHTRFLEMPGTMQRQRQPAEGDADDYRYI